MKRQFLVSLFLTVLTGGTFTLWSSRCTRQAMAASVKTPAETLYENLAIIYSGNATMLGHEDDPVYGHNWNGDSGRSDILDIVGDYPAVMSWDLGGLEQGWNSNLDSVPFVRMREEIKNHHKRGGYNTFSWHLFSPVDSTDAWTIGDSLTIKKIIIDPAVNNRFRTQVKSVAEFFNNLKDDSGEKIPVIFRPFHENSGNWFWWGKPYATPKEYNSLWQIIHEEFKTAGVDNVVFAYSPDRFQTEEEYMEYYPGNEFVDILGVDIYLFNGTEGVQDYCKTTDNALEIIRKIAAENGKIAAFTETGSEAIPIDNWWTEILLPLLKKHPMTYVVLWRNAHDKPNHYYAPFPGHSSEDSFKEFCNDSFILLTKDLK